MIAESIIDSAVKDIFENIKFTKEPAGLYDPLRYMIAIGGKRLRPKLCLTTYGMYKDKLVPEVTEPAAGLEICHSFTLIHDDIMDRSPLRRGVPTVWKKWGEDSGILSGDAMCIDSYKRIAKAPKEVLPRALELFSTTAAEVCEGQQMDMDFELVDQVPMAEYMKMIGLKTGVLLACASKMGALIAGAPEEDCENLYQYGFHLGLAFQVEDDYLDAFGDEKVFGKPIGGDIVNNKKCWLTTRALEKAPENLRKEILDTIAMPVETDEEKKAKVHRMKDLYLTLEIDRDVEAELRKLNVRAMGYADKVFDGIRYEALKRFLEKLIGRRK